MKKHAHRITQELGIKNSEGTTIYSCFEKPEGSGPFPSVIFIHGGFGDNREYTRALLGWSVAQRILQEGFVVFSTDYRHDLRGKDIDDIVTVFEYVSHLPYVDADRIAYFGDSHGAYLAMMAATRTKPFVLIHGWGVTDMAEWFEYIKNSPIPTYQRIAENLRISLGGEPQDVPEVYRQVSPLVHIDRIKCPVLIFHGEDDENVPVAHASWLAEVLKKAKKEYRLCVFKNAGHGLRSPEVRLKMDQAVLEFVKKRL
jgi:dipeptidyl aminopeptidase/acylaminoacyl peptidase